MPLTLNENKQNNKIISFEELRSTRFSNKKSISIPQLSEIFSHSNQLSLFIKNLKKINPNSTFSFTESEKVSRQISNLIQNSSADEILLIKSKCEKELVGRYKSIQIESNCFKFNDKDGLDLFKKATKGWSGDGVTIIIVYMLICRRNSEITQLDELFHKFEYSKVEIESLKEEVDNISIKHEDAYSEQILQKCISLLNECISVSEGSPNPDHLTASKDYVKFSENELFKELKNVNSFMSEKNNIVLKSTFSADGIQEHPNLQKFHTQMSHVFEWKLSFLNRLSQTNPQALKPELFSLLNNIKLNLIQGSFYLEPSIKYKNSQEALQSKFSFLGHYGVFLKDQLMVESNNSNHHDSINELLPNHLSNSNIKNIQDFNDLLKKLFENKKDTPEIIHDIIKHLYLELESKFNDTEINSDRFLCLLDLKRVLVQHTGYLKFSSYLEDMATLSQSVHSYYKEDTSNFFVPTDIKSIFKELFHLHVLMLGKKDDPTCNISSELRFELIKKSKLPIYHNFLYSEGSYQKTDHIPKAQKNCIWEVAQNVLELLTNSEFQDNYLENYLIKILKEEDIEGSIFFLLRDPTIIKKLISHPKLKNQSWMKKRFAYLVKLCNHNSFN